MLNMIGVLVFKALINSTIRHDEFISVNNLLKVYDNMNMIDIIKEKIFIYKTSSNIN